MRFRTPAVFGFAFVVSVIAGCAARQHPGADLEAWSTGSPPSVVGPHAPYQQYGASISPHPHQTAAPVASKQRAQFDFSHPRVDRFVTRFQTNMRDFYTKALSRSGRYVPWMSTILEEKGLPQELAYLPLIESGYSPHAVSRAGAVGPWQLIPGTGRRYGLRIDRYVDERRDPEKSTEAAAEYLKDLHDMFGDWHLSLAAYNTGEQNIVRILERRRIQSFWDMSARGFLYRETSNFVPEFLAALQIAEAPEAYGFAAPSEEPQQYDVTEVDRSLSLSTVAQLTGSSTETIRELNPALHRGVIPPDGYTVRLPKGTKDSFEIALANLPAIVLTSASTHSRHRSSKRYRHHRVRRGESLASVAKAHGVSVRSLASANGLRNPHNVRAGRTLRIPVIATNDQSPVLVARQNKNLNVD